MIEIPNFAHFSAYLFFDQRDALQIIGCWFSMCLRATKRLLRGRYGASNMSDGRWRYLD